jgi:ParB/RepB/Spo0J family partition protein
MYFDKILREKIRTSPRRDFRPSTPKQLAELKKSIKEFRILQPLIVSRIGEYYVIRDGNQRLEIANELGIDPIPCLIVEDNEINEIRMGVHANLFRRHLSQEEEIELSRWQSSLVNSVPSQLSDKSSRNDRETIYKLEITKKQERIDNLEMKVKSKEAEIRENKNKIRELRELLQQAHDDSDEFTIRKKKKEPTEDERTRKLEQDLEESDQRARRISEELDKVIKRTETLEDELRKEKSETAELKRNHNMILYKDRQSLKIRSEFDLMGKFCCDVLNRIDEEIIKIRLPKINNLVGEIKINLNKEKNALKQLLESVTKSFDEVIKVLHEIPEYPEEEEINDVE